MGELRWRPVAMVVALALVVLTGVLAADRAIGVPASPWSRVASLSMARDDFGLVAVDGRLWAIGGMTGDRGNALSSVEIFDPAVGRWVAGPPMPTARSSAGVALVGNTIYVAGGLASGFVTNAVESLDTRTSTWTRRAPMPTPRMQLAAAALDGRVWAVGGNDASGPPLSVVEVYDPAADRWTAAAPLSTPRYGLAAAALDGAIYVVGGQSAEDALTSVEIASADGRWRAGPSLPVGMTRLGLTVLNGSLHAMMASSHYVLPSGASKWNTAQAMATSRHGLAAAVLDGRLYAVGGCSDELVDLDTTEVLQP